MRKLPAVVYDTLEFSTLVYKGVGGGSAFLNYMDLRPDVPMCIVGYAEFAANEARLWEGPICDALRDAGVTASTNDRAVRRINRRKGRKDLHARVSWREYTRELDIVRGE